VQVGHHAQPATMSKRTLRTRRRRAQSGVGTARCLQTKCWLKNRSITSLRLKITAGICQQAVG
jgi:hypothetical protein